MRDSRRTSIILSTQLRKKLKEQCIDEDITMREFIENSIRNELKRKQKNRNIGIIKNYIFNDNVFAWKIIDELAKVLKSRRIASQVLNTCCAESKISPKHFNRRNLTKEFVECLCRNIVHIVSNDKAELLGLKLRKIGRGREPL